MYIMFTIVTSNLINSIFFILFIIFNGEIDNLSYTLFRGYLFKLLLSHPN